jgi:hypothetical protein
MGEQHSTFVETDGDRVEFGPDYQGVSLWLGDGGAPIHISDEMPAADLREYIEQPVRRAVIRARLEALADMLASDA